MLDSDFFQSYRMWSLDKRCAEILKFLKVLYTKKNEKIY